MGEHKNKFQAEGKVLRAADESPLTADEALLLISTLENGENSVSDLRTLNKLNAKIAAASSDTLFDDSTKFNEALRAAIMEHGAESAEARTASNAVTSYNKNLEALTLDDVLLSMSEADWIKTRWERNGKSFVGRRDVRDKIIKIDDIVNHMLGWRHTADKQVWIEGEPEPGTSPNGVANESVTRPAVELVRSMD